MKGLTNKQTAFIHEYLIDLNAAAAARRAGYSKRSSYAQGKQLMDTPAIRAAIRVAMSKRAKRVEVVADSVLRALSEIAHLDKTEAFRVQNGMLHVTDTDLLPPAVRRCISQVSQTQHGLRIAFDDRVKALELLGRHLALFVDRMEHSGPDGGAIPVEALSDADLERIAARGSGGAAEAPSGKG